MKREDYSEIKFSTFVEFFLAVFLLICCGWIIHACAHENTTQVQHLLSLEFMPDVRSSLLPELRERTTFISLTLLSFPICFAAIYICNAFRRVKQQIHISSMLAKTTAMNVFLLIIMVICFYQPQINPQFMYILFDPVWDYHIILFLVLALSLIAIHLLFKFNLNRSCGKFILPALMLIPLVQVLCSRTYTLNLVSNEVPFHANIIAYALSQAAAGSVDYHQYGFYQRMLAPVFKIIQPNMLGISVVMGILFMAGCFAIYWVLFKYIKNKALIPAFALVLFLTTGTWYFLDKGRQLSIDPCFTYYPVRFIFPALSVMLLSGMIFLRKKYITQLCGILAGLGIWWNFDSGINVIAAFSVMMCLEIIFSRERLSALIQFLTFFISAFLAFLALLIIFSIQQGCIISPAESLKYVKLFSSSGFMMMPLPGLPAPWCVFGGIYILAIIIGLRFFIIRKFNAIARISIFLPVLGIGLFTYYQGRSHIYNLPTVIWPALMLIFIYTDRIIRLVKTGLINKSFMMMTFPAVFLTFCAAATIACGSKMIVNGVERTCKGIIQPDETCLLEQNIRFILANAGDNKVVNIISDMQGVYYAETGLRAGIDNFGMVELFSIKDWTRIGQELRKAKVPLFIAKRRVADWIYKYYKLEAVSKDGSLVYFIPLATSAMQTTDSSVRTERSANPGTPLKN